jgi:hypothetical protein
MEKRSEITRNLIVTGLVALLMAGFVLAYTLLAPGQARARMGGMGADGPFVPPVIGYTEGEEILFVHTEASAPDIARMLSDMMGSPVLLVPSLAEARVDAGERLRVRERPRGGRTHGLPAGRVRQPAND